MKQNNTALLNNLARIKNETTEKSCLYANQKSQINEKFLSIEVLV